MIVAVALVVGTSVTGIPKRVGSYSWHPTTVATAERTYAVGVGAGELDLTDMDLPPGARVRFDASVSLGQLTVVVPPDAIVEVHGQTRLGDIKIDHQVSDGTDVRITRTLTPLISPEGQAATIELHVSRASAMWRCAVALDVPDRRDRKRGHRTDWMALLCGLLFVGIGVRWSTDPTPDPAIIGPILVGGLGIAGFAGILAKVIRKR